MVALLAGCLPALFALSVCGGKTSQGGLEITITTSGLQVGKDFDAIEAIVEQRTPACRGDPSPGTGWCKLFDRNASVASVPPEITLPTTLAVESGTSPNQLAHIEVTALSHGVPVVQRVIEEQVPSDRVESILVVLAADCLGKITACLPGSCQPATGGCGPPGPQMPADASVPDGDSSMSPDATSDATSGTNSGSSSDASTNTGPMSGHPVLRSAGCGMTPTIATGQWVQQPPGCNGYGAHGIYGDPPCQAIPPGSTPPAMPKAGNPEWRGWWVQLPSNYDPNKAYRVIYNGAGCPDPNWFHAGADGFAYQNFDGGNAILVGLDYDTYSDVPGCYDYRSPNSNDFLFFPWLQARIESEFCVDINHEFFSGYDLGASVAQQFNCAFPDKLRGTIAVTGCEPGAPGWGGSQRPCVSKPTAAFYAKDLSDNTFACILPACARVLTQNGCMVNGAVPKCDPQDKTITTPYPIPASLANVVNAAKVNLNCVQFNGCPADYPVVFCMYTDPGGAHNDTQTWGGPALYWDWMSNQLAN